MQLAGEPQIPPCQPEIDVSVSTVFPTLYVSLDYWNLALSVFWVQSMWLERLCLFSSENALEWHQQGPTYIDNTIYLTNIEVEFRYNVECSLEWNQQDPTLVTLLTCIVRLYFLMKMHCIGINASLQREHYLLIQHLRPNYARRRFLFKMHWNGFNVKMLRNSPNSSQNVDNKLVIFFK